MSLSFPTFTREQVEDLADFLTSEDWPFHAGGTPARSDVIERVRDGEFDARSRRTYWVVEDDTTIGVIRLDDLGDGTPLFDLRLKASYRGRGIGTECVNWLNSTVFQEFTDLNRIEATTRQDNVAMRRVLARCGYVKEAHYRQDWPSPGGRVFDTVGYAVLRSDWAAGTTTPLEWEDEP